MLVLMAPFLNHLFQRTEDFMNICIEPDNISKGDYIKRGWVLGISNCMSYHSHGKGALRTKLEWFVTGVHYYAKIQRWDTAKLVLLA